MASKGGNKDRKMREKVGEIETSTNFSVHKKFGFLDLPREGEKRGV